MENKHIDKIKNIHIWCIEMLIGILTLSIVTVIAVDSDMSSTQKSLSYTAKYINERCNSFTRLNLASETKSLMRMIESAQQINRNIAYELEYNGGSDIYSEEFLKRNTQECYVTAVIFLDKEGKLSAQYYTDGLGAEYLDEHLDSASLIDVSENVSKTYSTRIDCEDGSYIDLAACGMPQNEGIVVVYYHTSEEYVYNYNLSFEHVLTGYDDKEDGNIVVASGNKIIASNNKAMVSEKVDNYAILNNIKDKNRNNNIHNVSNGKLELDELEMILVNDAAWLDSAILQRGSDIDRETVLEYLKMFFAEQKMKSSDKREIIDIQKHFRNWLNIKMNYRLKHERAESKRVNSGRRATEITATSPEDYDWPV